MDKAELEQAKICVVGIGGVGGNLAALLASRYSRVTLAARGARKEALKKNGIILHRQYGKDIHAVPENVVNTAELNPQDYIFVCVKNYSLEQVCKEIAPAVTENTVVVPIMNGVDPGERTRKLLGKGTVIDSLVYMVGFSNPDYSVTQVSPYARIFIGIQNADEKQKGIVRRTEELLVGAGAQCRAAKDIEYQIWRKYILNSAFNVLTAYYGENIGPLRQDPVKAKEYEALVHESYQLALSRNIPVKQADIDEFMDDFYHNYTDDFSSSLQRDMAAGRRSEYEIFSGYIVREAKKAGLAVPVTERMYEGLKKREEEQGKRGCFPEHS